MKFRATLDGSVMSAPTFHEIILWNISGMKFHDGGGGMVGYPHHNLMDMYPGPAINTMDWKNTSQVRAVHLYIIGSSNSHSML